MKEVTVYKISGKTQVCAGSYAQWYDLDLSSARAGLSRVSKSKSETMVKRVDAPIEEIRYADGSSKFVAMSEELREMLELPIRAGYEKQVQAERDNALRWMGRTGKLVDHVGHYENAPWYMRMWRALRKNYRA